MVWIYERLANVRDEPHMFCGSMEVPQECERPTAGIEWVCISYNAVMSVYPCVS